MCNFVKLRSRKNLEELFGFFYLKIKDFRSCVKSAAFNLCRFIHRFYFQYCTKFVKISGRLLTSFLFDLPIKTFITCIKSLIFYVNRTGFSEIL